MLRPRTVGFFTLPILLSLSSLVLTHPLAEPEVAAPAETTTETQVAATEHLASTAHFFTESAAAAVVTTENGLSTDACKPVIVIFARGTNEAGNVGEIAGPPLFASLRAALTTAKTTVQGVDYTADVIGRRRGRLPQPRQPNHLRQQQMSRSQTRTQRLLPRRATGAQRGENFIRGRDGQDRRRRRVWGSGLWAGGGWGAAAKVLSICHALDIICTGVGGFTTHLTYGNDADTASAFIVKAVGTV
ncbi:hypothetical protein DID88_004171 [Monilinia fructigena]|uniref:cutinase n=1 Tax=Monilinia fructigena TaxID=38457 RepID=A0A395IRZ0_9HELO|nr:hypothetical protein DID88_004171 [Monilinia fructigena]